VPSERQRQRIEGREVREGAVYRTTLEVSPGEENVQLGEVWISAGRRREGRDRRTQRCQEKEENPDFLQ